MNLPLYWKKVRQAMEQLPEAVWLTSLENDLVGTKAGSVVVCDQKLAAERLVSATHRLATQDEIARFEAYQQERLRGDEQRVAKYAPKSILVVTTEQQQQMSAMAGVPPAVTAPAPRVKAGLTT